MVRPDFRDYRGAGLSLVHSAKGSQWEKHKYLREVGGKYYYPDSYKGGRHLPKGGKDGNGNPATLPEETADKKSSSTSNKKASSKKSGTDKKTTVAEEISKKSVIELALEAVSGKLGSISQYKEALGSKYDKVQERVREIVNKSQITEASKKETDAKAKKLAKRKPISAPQTEKKTKTLSKEEKEEEDRAKRLQAKTIVKTNEEKNEETEDKIQNEKKSTSAKPDLDRARLSSSKKDVDKLAESVVNKNYSKVLTKAMKEAKKKEEAELKKKKKK